MVVITPQTASIAAGAALISFVSYRVLLPAAITVIGACAAYLVARPAPEPAHAVSRSTATCPGSVPSHRCDIEAATAAPM
jgi:hypothetical protein